MSSGLTFDESTGVISHSGRSNSWQSICGAEFVSSGQHSWSIKIHANVSNWLFIGVADKRWTGWMDQSSGYVGYQANSWSYGSYANWGKTTGGHGQHYGVSYKTGDIVTIVLDMDQKEVSFNLNGNEQGVAFKAINADEVCPVVTLYQTGDQVSVSDV